jgi:hypothetical protein
MLVADGEIYVPNQSGDVFALQAGPKFEVLATSRDSCYTPQPLPLRQRQLCRPAFAA